MRHAQIVLLLGLIATSVVYGEEGKEPVENVVPAPPQDEIPLNEKVEVPQGPKPPNLIPWIQLGDQFTLKMDGFTQVHYTPEDGNRPRVDKIRLGDDDFQWSSFRIRGLIDSPTPLGGYVEVEAAEIGEENANWIRRAEVWWELNDKWTLRAGRLFLSTGFITPPPFLQKTVLYPRVPLSSFAYGIQVEGNLGDGWCLKTDLTAASGVAFDASENWDRMEMSSRVVKTFNKNLFVAGSTQVSEDFVRFVIDGGYQVTPELSLIGAGYVNFEEDVDIQGGYVLAAYNLTKWLEVHTMIDYQNRNLGGANDDSTIWTNGIRIWAPNDQMSFTVDYECDLDSDIHTSRVLARLQFRF